MKTLAIVLPIALLGCAVETPAPNDASAADRSVAPQSEAARQAPPEVVQPAVEGDTVLAVGQVLEIALEGNASTGYSWEVVSDGAPQLVQRPAPPAEASPADSGARPAVGAPETHRWRFEAARPGEATVRLAYRRPWEKDVAPAREAVFKVAVRGQPD